MDRQPITKEPQQCGVRIILEDSRHFSIAQPLNLLENSEASSEGAEDGAGTFQRLEGLEGTYFYSQFLIPHQGE